MAVGRDPDDCHFIGSVFHFARDLELDLKLLAFWAPASIKLDLSFDGVVLKVSSLTPFT
jgi:hypothetical protein